METYQVMVFVGKQIAMHDTRDNRYIERVILNSSAIASKVRTIYSWSLFDWVDANQRTFINSQIGIVKGLRAKVEDSYIWKCPQQPWTLQLSHPNVGNTSGIWTIPAGIGITNSQNKYLGTLNVGFNIAEINAKIQQNLSLKEASFIILDHNYRVILQSADNAIDPKSSYYYDLLKTQNYFKDYYGHLAKSIYYKDIDYIYYKKMKEFPYIILLGVNKEYLHILWAEVLPIIIELNSLGFFCLGLLYLLRRKLFNVWNSTDKSEMDFNKRIYNEMAESISFILFASNVLMKHLKGETKTNYTKEKQIRLLGKIHQEASNLNNMTGNVTNPSLINVANLVNSSVALQIKAALKKEIYINTAFDSELPPFFGDEFRLKQIIVGLISLSMRFNPRGATIKVSVYKQSKNNKAYLVIKIEDDGFSLDDEDIQRLSERFDDEGEGLIEYSLGFNTIEKLVKMHRGTCHIKNKQNKGKIMTVKFPYFTKNENEQPPTNQVEMNNVYWLMDRHPNTNLNNI